MRSKSQVNEAGTSGKKGKGKAMNMRTAAMAASIAPMHIIRVFEKNFFIKNPFRRKTSNDSSQKRQTLSSLIQTVLSVPELHRIMPKSYLGSRTFAAGREISSLPEESL